MDQDGQLWVVWAANDGRQWDLWARGDGEPVKLTANTLNDFWPRLARDGRGNLWLAWQTVADDLHYEIMLARLGPKGLATPVNVSEHKADDWEPAICTATGSASRSRSSRWRDFGVCHSLVSAVVISEVVMPAPK